MFPKNFEGANVTLNKPKDMSDEECMPLSVHVGEIEGTRYFVSCWQPSKEGIEAINAGRPIWLQIIGMGHPPLSIYTKDENGEANQ